MAAFASKNSVTSSVLSELLTDAITRLHNCGFTVDAVTMDGAQWNRGVWTIHGITIDNLFCPHPCDETKRLWFLSDFPHLIKCLRNLIMKLQQFWVRQFNNYYNSNFTDLLILEIPINNLIC